MTIKEAQDLRAEISRQIESLRGMDAKFIDTSLEAGYIRVIGALSQLMYTLERIIRDEGGML